MFSTKVCADTNEYPELFAELTRQVIELPVDYEGAEAVVMDQLV